MYVFRHSADIDDPATRQQCREATGDVDIFDLTDPKVVEIIEDLKEASTSTKTIRTPSKTLEKEHFRLLQYYMKGEGDFSEEFSREKGKSYPSWYPLEGKWFCPPIKTPLTWCVWVNRLIKIKQESAVEELESLGPDQNILSFDEVS